MFHVVATLPDSPIRVKLRGTTWYNEMTKMMTASKTRSNRPGWSITFRHPLRQDSQGRLGLKVRRGLGTNDADEADRLVTQMNELLRDPSWWNATRRSEAEARFELPIVKAFFDDLQAGSATPEHLRDQYLKLPWMDEGYARILFVGTTGAGKTTLLRQLIGSDPDIDRFPSTAPAKTTIADIEVIMSPSPYQAIVTFFTEFQVQTYVEECILDAALAVHAEQPIFRVAERFLNHRDQKFRLSYILGPGINAASVNDDSSFDDELSFDDDEQDSPPSREPDEDAIPASERTANAEAVAEVLRRIGDLARSVSEEISEELGVKGKQISKEDQDAFMELLGEEFERELYTREDFHNLTQDVMDMIRVRFDRISVGVLSYGASGWPQSWTFKTKDRSDFIQSIRWFSSNYWPQFGQLLTPIVNGIRVQGPLYSEVQPQGAKLVLIDGQGLGHTPDDATSVTTHVTRKFAEVDVVLLVDNAQQPMQAAPVSVLKALAISGYEDKLAIAFTHFDQIKGQNLPGMAERRAHVMASVISAITNLQDTVGVRIARTLERGIDDRCFMLGGTQKKLSTLKPKAAAYMAQQLKTLIEFCLKAAEPKDQPKAAFVYDPIGISFAVQNGASKFNKAWKARLGLATYANLRKEHWTRIKALNKRIAGEFDVEYDTLRPVADLQTYLLEAISRYLDAPVSEPGIDAEQQATTRIRQLVAASLNKLVRQRLIDAKLTDWRNAYEEKGSGSATRRAMHISEICYAAAPIPDAVMSTQAKAFLDEVAGIIASAIKAVGGTFRSLTHDVI